MAAASSSSISWLRSTMGASFFFALGAKTGPAAKRPTMRRRNASGSVPANSSVSRRVIQVALFGAAVVVTGDDVLRHVDQAPGQVARVGGAKGGVGETLAGAVGRDEVLEDGHALAEVGAHGHVDDAAGRVGHQAAHAAQLTDVALVTAGARAVIMRHRTAPVGSRRLAPSSWPCRPTTCGVVSFQTWTTCS